MMRKFLISLAVATSALAVATPAAAQYAPPPPPGYGYGHNNYGQVRRLQARIDQIQRRIVLLDRRNVITNREARKLHEDSRNIERRLRRAASYGLNGQERHDIERRIARLEQRLFRDARDGRGWNNGQNDGRFYDRDRDGRDDRYEDDRGRRRD